LGSSPGLTPQDIIREVTLYVQKVQFFSTLESILRELGLTVYVEHTARKADGGEIVPDFFVVTRPSEATVIEHKSSLPRNRKYAGEELSSVFRRYMKSVVGHQNTAQRVVVAYPHTCSEVVEQLSGELEPDLGLWEFTMAHKAIHLRDINRIDHKLEAVVENSPYQFDQLELSRHRFIRESPHPVYTSFFLLNIIFPSFMNPLDSRKRRNLVLGYSEILEKTKSFYSPWIEVEQVSRGRLNEAFEFLSEVGLLEWNTLKQEVVVQTRKTLRKGEMIDWLSHLYAEKYEAKASTMKGKQKLVTDFIAPGKKEKNR